MIAKTALYQEHEALGAKIVDFHGWLMPLHYGSQLQEHQEVRHHAGLFDVSHMTIVDMFGEEIRPFLRSLLTNDIDTHAPRAGQALYTCMCNDEGGIIDDLIVYHLGPNKYRLVLNSATRDRDLAWLKQHIQPYKAEIQVRTDLSMIAIQGPKAIETTLRVLSPEHANATSLLKPFESIELDAMFIARTGYTGEDGFEVIASHEHILDLWQKLLSNGATPCGLAARDTLRMEAGLLLYGQDMNETTSPLESGLAWTISWEPKERDFIGKNTLLSQKNEGLSSKLVGLTLQEKGIMRSGQRVIIEGHPDGVITSGTFSPTLNQSIGFARVPITTNTTVWVDIRDKHCKASVGKLRFINKGKTL